MHSWRLPLNHCNVPPYLSHRFRAVLMGMRHTVPAMRGTLLIVPSSRDISLASASKLWPSKIQKEAEQHTTHNTTQPTRQSHLPHFTFNSRLSFFCTSNLRNETKQQKWNGVSCAFLCANLTQGRITYSVPSIFTNQRSSSSAPLFTRELCPCIHIAKISAIKQ